MITEDQVIVENGLMTVRRSPGRGKPLILIHGLLDNASSWDYISQSLSRPVIAVNLPGAGASSLAEQSTLQSYADTVQQCLDMIQVSDYHLLGHSLGGAVASQIANDSPEKIRSLTLLSPAGYGRLPLAEVCGIKGVSHLLALTTPTIFRSEYFLNLSYKNFISNHKPMEKELRQRLHNERQAVVPGAICATKVLSSISRNPFKEPNNYQGKTLVVWGEKDHLTFASHRHQLIKVLPQAEIKLVANVGHHPQYEWQKPLLKNLAKHLGCSLLEVADSEQMTIRKRHKYVQKPAIRKPVIPKLKKISTEKAN
jgi:pyruvate dehydrogenase E2 component (dihydrolipoamide acetyltransferase)